jgi:predicted small secreted protein
MISFFIATGLGMAAGIILTLMYCKFREEDREIDPHDPDFNYKDF